jgi:hypothetical protein
MKTKLTKYILSGALALGLTTFAANQAQAIVLPAVYLPLNFKLVAYYTDSHGKIQKVRIGSKDVLKQLGYTTKGDELAYANHDVYVINKNTVVTDLSSNGYIISVSTDLVSSESPGSGGAFKEASAGSFDVSFYSDPQFVGDSFDQVASEDASAYWFEITGVYTSKITGSAIKNGEQTLKETLNTQLDGQGVDVNVDGGSDLPIAGTGTASGSGKVAVAPAVSLD